MDKAKPFFWVELGVSEKSAHISKTRTKKMFFAMYIRPAKF